MYRLTSNEVRGLMEAYNDVYAPQELTEEQIWEEVETWVNSLVEEGYDLSDYTWEEMYKSYIDYIEEQGGRGSSTASQTNQSVSGAQIASAIRSAGNVLAYGNRQGTRPTTQSRQTNVRGGGTTRPVSRPEVSNIPPQEGTGRGAPTGRLGNIPSQEGTGKGGSSDIRPPRPTVTTPAPTRPAATPVRPAGTPLARPSTPARPTAPQSTTPKPEIKKGPTGMPLVGGIERRIPTSAELKAAQEKRAAVKSVASSFTSPPISGAPKYTPPVYNLKQSYDLYDVIKGHLLDEGYADTEEAAEAIMVSMSEDWKQSILEVSTPPHPVDLPPPVSSPPPVNSLPKLTNPPSVPKEKDKRLPKLTTPPPVPPAKIPPLPPVK